MRNNLTPSVALICLALVLASCQSDNNQSPPDKDISIQSDSGQSNTTQSNTAQVEAIKVAENTGSVELVAGKSTLLNSDITVYKSPTCGCCTGWVTYLEEEGFNVTAIDHDDVDSIKDKYGLPSAELKSCHTAIVDGYLVEGHVPANDIQRLLQERPANIKGLSAPGMPMMSPGMASRIPKDYAVLSFTESGQTAVYSQY